MQILIIEDQQELSDSIYAYLSQEHFTCERAFDFHSALEKILFSEYACIVLDITLPHGSGLDLLKLLKEQNKADGVLIISARDSLDDKVQGLNLGADDYLTKPFHLPELLARISAILRRKSFVERNRLILDKLVIDLQDKTAKGANGLIDLTRKEFELLVYFASNKNKVITKEAIVEHLWGGDIDMADNYDFIYTHVKNLRRKLMQAGCPDYIRGIYGMGYKFTAK